jgi:hypothetical protein
MSMRVLAETSILLLLLATACGRQDLEDEFRNVPLTALLHLHFERPLPPQVWSFIPEGISPVDPGLARDLLDRGPLGVSLVAIDITNLKPQLLLLSSSVPPETALALAARYMEFSPESASSRTDMRSPQGRLLGSVASRGSWTALYIGPSTEVVMPAWLELPGVESLWADSTLGLISHPTGADVSLFMPSGFVSFLALAPVGNYVPGWADVRSAMALLQPRAARLDLSFRDFVAVEVRLVREAAKVSRVRIELEDSGFTPGEMLSALQLALLGGPF